MRIFGYEIKKIQPTLYFRLYKNFLGEPQIAFMRFSEKPPVVGCRLDSTPWLNVDDWHRGQVEILADLMTTGVNNDDC